MLAVSRIFANSLLSAAWPEKKYSQFTNLNIFGGDFTLSDVKRIWMLHLTGQWMVCFGIFTHLVYAPKWRECDQTFLLYCLEKSLKGNTWGVQWPIKLSDLWPQLFPLCERRQEWWFIHGKRSFLLLICCELLFCTLPHSPWHQQVWGTQPEHLSAAGGGTATFKPWKNCFEAAEDPSVLQKKQRDAGFY